MCTHKVSEELGFRPQVAILCSAYEHQLSVELSYLDSVKTLHLFGENDRVVPLATSAELCAKMKGVKISHELGHVIPIDHLEQALKSLLR